MPLHSPRDDRPEHIHMVVCGVVFLGAYAVLRALHLNHLLASIVVLLFALPLMYVSTPLTALIYGAISERETRRSTIHVTDAGCSTLVFLFFLFLLVGVLEGSRHKKQSQHTKSSRPSLQAK